MSTNNNKEGITWSQCIVSSILAFILTMNILAEQINKIKEKEAISTSTSTTETPIPSTELDIETIIQTTIPTIEEAKPKIESIESTIETTPPMTSTNDNNNEFNLEKYIKAIDNIKVYYKHQKYYPTTNDTFKQFADASTTTTKCDYIFSGDTHIIGTKLLENSQKYISENPKYVIPFKDESSKNEELITQQIWFEITLYKIIGSWDNNTNNINEDFCSLEDYSIVFSFDEEEYENLLAYTTHNTLIIFPKRIQQHAAIVNETFEDTLYAVMNHQLNIIRQRACKCRISRGQSYFQIPTKTLTDAASEAGTKDYDNPTMYSLNYYDEKESEELLLTLGLFRDGTTYNDYYNAIYNSDLESLHKFFNATTEEEINKLYTILYAIDAVNLKNDLLLTYYDEDDLVSFNDIKSFVGHSYKIDIFKIVLKNLMQYTNTHNDFTIEDNLVMYKYIEGLIIKDSHIMFVADYENGNARADYEPDFRENIYTLRNIYYEFLCNKYNISIEEIKELESIDINSIIFYIDSYCRDNYSYIPQKHQNTIKNLVKRFPLLEAIAKTQKSLMYEFELFEGKSR